MRQQRGAASSFIMTCTAIILAGIVLVKVVPPYIQYYSAKQIIATMAQDPATAGRSLQEIEADFMRRVRLSSLTDITPDDLTVEKHADHVAFDLDYSVKVHLLAQISLLLDFHYATPS